VHIDENAKNVIKNYNRYNSNRHAFLSNGKQNSNVEVKAMQKPEQTKTIIKE